MLALVETFNGETVTLPVEEGPNPIWQVLAEVEDKGYDVSSVRFFPKTIQIIVQTPIGYPITLLVKRYDSIESVKSQIQAKEGIPPEEQRLFLSGKRLKDDQRIRSYNISNGSILEMNMVSGDGIVDDGEFPSELQDGIICFLSDTKLIGVDAVKMLISKLHSSPTSLQDAPLLFHHDLARRGFPQGMRLLRVNNKIYLSVDPSSEQLFQFNPRNFPEEQFIPEKLSSPPSEAIVSPSPLSEVTPLKCVDLVDLAGTTYLIVTGCETNSKFLCRNPSSMAWKALDPPPLLTHNFSTPISFYYVINNMLFIHRRRQTYCFQPQSGGEGEGEWKDATSFGKSILSSIPPDCSPAGRALCTQLALPGLPINTALLVAPLLRGIPNSNQYEVVVCGILPEFQSPKMLSQYLCQELDGLFDLDGLPDIGSPCVSIFHLGNGVVCAVMVASAVENTILAVSRFTLELVQDNLRTATPGRGKKAAAVNFLSMKMHQKRVWKFSQASGQKLEAFLGS